MSRPTDQEILDLLADRPNGMMTYVIRNWLDHHDKLTTAAVLRQLKAMEKAGKVCRKPSPYAVQICWAIAKDSTA